MKKSYDIKEQIISVTTDLINQSNGDVSAVTTRGIADKVGVGRGLINYHFQTKENLIEICVQRMIGQVITNFNPNIDEQGDFVENLKQTVKTVFDFYIKYPAMSKISILGDLQKPSNSDNTSKGNVGFSGVMNNSHMSESEKATISFILLSTIQVALLRKSVVKDMLGYDLDQDSERYAFIDSIIEKIIHIK